MKVIRIDGGIGRTICSIPAIEQLSRKNNPITIITGIPEIFENNPHIDRVYPITNKYLWEDVISKGEYIVPEPYYQQPFYNNKIHLIQAFELTLLNQSNQNIQKPQLYFTNDEITTAQEFIKKVKIEHPKKKIVLFQPFGAACKAKSVKPPVINQKLQEINKNNPVFQKINQSLEKESLYQYYDNTFRSLSYQHALKIVTQSKNCIFLYTGHVTLKADNLIHLGFNLKTRLAIVKEVDFIVGIDSCMQHAGYLWGKPGIILWGSTSIVNFGYAQYENIQKENFPKKYTPFRIADTFQQNQGAMDFTEEEMENIISKIQIF